VDDSSKGGGHCGGEGDTGKLKFPENKLSEEKGSRPGGGFLHFQKGEEISLEFPDGRGEG